MTGIPANNYESFQVLQYQAGQFYKRHHDSPNANGNKATGHRILSFLLYLNDVGEGGETRFTDLDISIAPRKVWRHIATRLFVFEWNYVTIYSNRAVASVASSRAEGWYGHQFWMMIQIYSI